ncbi:MAG: hypothetical protein M3Y21_02655, partial [Candidatus Eremiobacteraeota bacterium]|nr:hypothetical protein [Candidatus Eremiobacteraeota bacterium]
MISQTLAPGNLAEKLPQGFLDFYAPLHVRFNARRAQLLRSRAQALHRAHDGALPEYLAPERRVPTDWKIALPGWCRDQRNQMTGPADDAELVVKMLNSGAPGVMLDLEDSMANTWDHVLQGHANIVSALYGELAYADRKHNAIIGISPSSTVIWNRVRGLHIAAHGVLDEPTSASLFDVALVAFQLDYNRLKHPLAIYIPKSESADEALWWRDVFQAVIEAKQWARGSIRCMALVESHPIAFQLEAFIYNLRDYIVGLNLGRWDYMASLIHFTMGDPNWLLPDRNTIPLDVPFFQNLRRLIPEICHKHGLLAIGGMTALYPSREDGDLNARALDVLARDKRNEAGCLMDGAWTGHPDQNAIAVAQFPAPNQIEMRAANVELHPNLRPAPIGVG